MPINKPLSRLACRWIAALAFPVAPPALAASLQTTPLQSAHSLKDDAALYTQHLHAIAGPLATNRVPGAFAHASAADYITRAFTRLGLEDPTPAPQAAHPDADSPADATGFRVPFQRPFTQPGPLEIATQSLTLHLPTGDVPLEPATGFNPLGHSGSKAIERAPVTFAGYAVSIADDGYATFGVNDRFRDMDAPKDEQPASVALILTHEPLDEEGYSYYHDTLGRWTYLCSITAKLAATERRGAAAALLVTAPGVNDPDAQDPLLFDPRAQGRFDHFPAASIARQHADQLIAAAFPQGPDLLTLRNDADLEGGLTPLPNVSVSIDIDLSETEHAAPILIARLPGAGDLAQEHILVISHYDAAPPRTQREPRPAHIYTDPPNPAPAAANAHGSAPAAALFAAQRLAEHAQQRNNDSRRSILFAYLSDGATPNPRSLKHFTAHTPVPFADITTVVTLGPVAQPLDGQAYVQGVATAERFESLLNPLFDASDLIVSTEGALPRTRVHAAFTNRRRPVLHLTTGPDPQETPADDTVAQIRPQDAARVARLLTQMLHALATDEPTPRYTDPRGEDEPPPRPYAGIRPRGADFLEDEGVYVAAVAKDSPAERAGIQPGDRIAEWNGQPVDSIADYAERLGASRPGDTIQLKLDRAGDTIETDLNLDASG